MLQLILLGFLTIVYVLVRHLWRHQEIYRQLLRFSAGEGPNKGPKRIVACPACGSSPEVSGERCSRCGYLMRA